MRRGSTITADGTDTVYVSGESRRPKHRIVFDTLLSEISSGRFQPGDRMPTEAELAKTFQASRTTIARAMRDLKGKGLLNRARGGGTRIALKDDLNRVALFAPFAQNAANLGFIGGQIHAHLSDLASQRGDDLRLQLIGRKGTTLLDQMLSAVDDLIDKQVSGVFYYPVELPQETAHFNTVAVDRLRAAGLSVVLVDRDIVAFPQRSGLPLVAYDNRRAGYLVTNHLIGQGCKRIVFVGIPYVSSAASDRMRGYADALEDHGIPLDRSLIRSANFEELDANFCKALIEQTKPDAIVCKMDHYAAAIGRHLVEMGMKIGQDIMLSGFDNQPIAEALQVPLTTIRFPIEPFVDACYERLVKQMADPEANGMAVTSIDVELIVRASTGASISRARN